MKAKFALGQCVSTPGALAALNKNGQLPLEFIARHQSGDWGTVNANDKQANEDALKEGARILSAYLLKDNQKIWVITESDRSSTCILLPDEY
jgi:hypothetical protein